MDLIAIIAGILFLGFASWHDMRTREVPDLISYGLLIFSIGYGLAKSLILWDWVPLAQMAIGLAAMVALGFLLFYTGQWGGADSKLLMGLGALLGLGFGNWDAAIFLVVALFAGAAYGLLYTLALTVKHRAAFKKRFATLIREQKIHRARILVLVICFLLLGLIIFLPSTAKIPMVLLVAAVYTLFYAWLVVKAVEESILIKQYPVSKLREGDWIQKEVKVKGKYICGPKDLGISNEQIAKLKKLKVKHVLVKEGIPFVPSFLLGFLLLWLFKPVLYAFLP